MNSFLNASPQALRRAADLQERIIALQSELNQLLTTPTDVGVLATPKRRRMSAAGRARIAAAARARWAKFRSQGGSSVVNTGRRKMSAAAKARLSAIARARWKKAKASGQNAL